MLFVIRLFFILTTLVYSAELLADFSYTDFTVSYRDALDRLCDTESVFTWTLSCYIKFFLYSPGGSIILGSGVDSVSAFVVIIIVVIVNDCRCFRW